MNPLTPNPIQRRVTLLARTICRASRRGKPDELAALRLRRLSLLLEAIHFASPQQVPTFLTLIDQL